MDVPRGSRRARHAASAASSQEASLQAQAQLELEAATQHRRTRRQALQVQVTPDASIAVAAGVHVHQAPEFGHRRREMEPPPNPFRLHRCELMMIYLMLLIFISLSRVLEVYKASVIACILLHDWIIKGGRVIHPLIIINVDLVSGWLLVQFGVTCESLSLSLFFPLLSTSTILSSGGRFFIPPRLLWSFVSLFILLPSFFLTSRIHPPPSSLFPLHQPVIHSFIQSFIHSAACSLQASIHSFFSIHSLIPATIVFTSPPISPCIGQSEAAALQLQ
ncbi:hypothetical protein J3E69DRAFT_154325 [Trichoderma sp. SZMC 28015]